MVGDAASATNPGWKHDPNSAARLSMLDITEEITTIPTNSTIQVSWHANGFPFNKIKSGTIWVIQKYMTPLTNSSDL
jgi:hypothetical protein